MHIRYRRYGEILRAAECITRYWRHAWGLRKRFVTIKKLVSILQPLVRKYLNKARITARNRAATIIQKDFKRFVIYKKYRNQINERMKVRNHRDMMARQLTMKKQRDFKKQAVRFIENQWIVYQEKKKLKEVRKYLWNLPYECRLLYFKFQQVKQDADSLKTDVDLLIAKKQGKIPT